MLDRRGRSAYSFRPMFDSLSISKLRRATQKKLIPWFHGNMRELPWRAEPRQAYPVWISEIMLQQTQVNTVVPYFHRFLKRFPTPAALAKAPLQDVLKVWEGLGYYTRARQLHAAAKKIMTDFGGVFPDNPADIRTLPGMGPYTTAAISSFAFGRPMAVLDGNVIRIFSRWLALPDDTTAPATRKALQQLADRLLLQGQPAACNEAWMELGALVCTPRSPQCPVCPMKTVCAGYKTGHPEMFPVKKAKMKVPHKVVGAAVIMNRQNHILIAQRRTDAMLGGLWEFPGGKIDDGETMPECIQRELKEEMGLNIDVGPCLTVVHHAYSHFTIELHAHFACIRSGRPRHLDCAGHAWVKDMQFDAFPFSKADLEIIRALRTQADPMTFRRLQKVPG